MIMGIMDKNEPLRYMWKKELLKDLRNRKGMNNDSSVGKRK
jgi:hypothetical protein